MNLFDLTDECMPMNQFLYYLIESFLELADSLGILITWNCPTMG